MTPESSPFVPHMGARELRATWDMLVSFKKAIIGARWGGDEVQAVAMGLQMIIQMEGQYRAQVDMAEKREKSDMSKAKMSVVSAGGTINKGGRNGTDVQDSETDSNPA